MRQLLFATSLVTSGAVSSVTTEGALGIAQIDDSTGEMTFVNTPVPDFEKENPYLDQNGKHHLNLVLVRAAANGGNVVLPLYPNHYDIAKAEYQAATTFVATLTVPTPDSEYYDYTIIAVKKGILAGLLLFALNLQILLPLLLKNLLIILTPIKTVLD